MESADKIKENLPQFTGTEGWHKWSILCRNLRLTDGTQYLAEAGGCYWLMDIIASVQGMPRLKNQDFQVIYLRVDAKKRGVVTIEDGNKNVLYTQKISYTDFPLDEVEIWKEGDVILLPSEH